MKQAAIKSLKAKADAKKSPVDKFAEFVTKFFGSISFLIFNIIFFAIWILWNTGILPLFPVIDPFPFGGLTMVVSLEAIFLSVIVLISQNREARISELRSEIDLFVDKYAEQEITKLIYLQTLLLKKNGIDISKDEEVQAMLEKLESRKVEQELEKQL